MRYRIRFIVCLFAATAPLSETHAASIDLVAFDGQNPDVRFHTFGRRPVVDEAGRVFFFAVFGSGIGAASRG